MKFTTCTRVQIKFPSLIKTNIETGHLSQLNQIGRKYMVLSHYSRHFQNINFEGNVEKRLKENNRFCFNLSD